MTRLVMASPPFVETVDSRVLCMREEAHLWGWWESLVGSIPRVSSGAASNQLHSASSRAVPWVRTGTAPQSPMDQEASYDGEGTGSNTEVALRAFHSGCAEGRQVVAVAQWWTALVGSLVGVPAGFGSRVPRQH